MVHALETVHDVLAPGGRVIDIHPVTERAEFLVQVAGELKHAGYLRETDDGIEYANAERALASVVESGLFVIEEERTFPFVHHTQNLDDMREHLARTWKDAIIDDEVAARIAALLGEQGLDRQVLLREEPRVTRLRPGQPDL